MVNDESRPLEPLPFEAHEDMERTRQFQVVLRKAIQRCQDSEPTQEIEKEPSTDRISAEIELVFAPYQSDPLMTEIAQEATRFLRKHHKRQAEEGRE